MANRLTILCFKMKYINVIFFLMMFSTNIISQGNDWIAPNASKEVPNPIDYTEYSIKSGKSNYDLHCAVCHGNKGKGNGLAGAALEKKPANLTKANIQNQSDGEIFWKLSEGRTPMAAYKYVLSEKERWHLVNYIRKIGS